MRPVRSIVFALGALLAVLVVSVAGLPAWPVAATASSPLPVNLGTHRFGHLRAPEAIVAKAGPDEVGWNRPREGPSYGPWAFDVARDGSVWLLDEVNNRLLVWSSGRPNRPARSVPLPFKAADNFALGRNGTVYVTSWPAGSGRQETLYALTSAGQVRWSTRLFGEVFGGSLLVGGDGIAYHQWGADLANGYQVAWAPTTTPAGAPLPVAEQHRRSSPDQPLPGGLRLASTWLSWHETRFTLLDRAGRVVRAWRVTSKTDAGDVAGFVPSLVGGDPVVALAVSRKAATRFLYEYLVLRLAPTGGTRLRFALEARAGWGDVETPLRVGPDGTLYQLRSNPATGVSIARYALAPATATMTSTTTPSGGSAVPPSTVAPPPATSSPPATATMPPTTAPAVQGEPASRRVVPWLAALASSALCALLVWLAYRHRHGSGRHRQPRPAH